jgi:hypothetical protein
VYYSGIDIHFIGIYIFVLSSPRIDRDALDLPLSHSLVTSIIESYAQLI